MDMREFVELVAAMRAAQSDYFLTGNRESLVRAKRLEKEVDAEIARHSATQKQQRLF